MSDNEAVAERHASWLELFFDLVVVAAVAQLAHRVHDAPSAAGVAAFALLYYAVWNVWTSFTLYANVAGRLTRQRAMLIAMFGIAVMAAAVPTAVPEALHDAPDVDHSRTFVIAYIVCRMLASSTWQRTGKILTSWPSAQAGAGLLPWFASIWVDAPARYWLWALGAALDLTFSIRQSRDPDRLLEAVARQSEQRRRRHGPGVPPAPTRAILDLSHLGERLGLFVIIVLGEAVIQLVDAAGNPLSHWDARLVVAALSGFALLVGLWWLTLQHGVNGVPYFEAEGPTPTAALPGHFAATVSITSVAAGLGAVAAHASGHLPDGTRWLLCGGLALYFLATTVLGAMARLPLRWLLGWALPCVAAPVLAAALGADLPAWSLALLMAAVVAWQVAYPRVTGGR
ncbi:MULTISPECIES: low temperature requirement protein A [Actinomadura]|uniref:Low temperature requirement protein A n=1 Tax=Actinomadura yumaensis TaxID=111807 RepID=A0ABW2CL12_9ACTN|nr:low temperature requirement protein A [Actinomadura sp. J1-007]